MRAEEQRALGRIDSELGISRPLVDLITGGWVNIEITSSRGVVNEAEGDAEVWVRQG